MRTIFTNQLFLGVLSTTTTIWNRLTKMGYTLSLNSIHKHRTIKPIQCASTTEIRNYSIQAVKQEGESKIQTQYLVYR